jgi:hypothetical protein
MLGDNHSRPVVLTGDRETGPLHLGRYVLHQGTMRVRRQTQATLDELRDALGLFQLSS